MSGFEPGEGWREVDPESVGRHDLHLTDPETGRVVRAWVRVPPVPPLPTEPGYYLAEQPSYGDTVVVELLGSPKGQWVDAGDRDYLQPDDVRVLGPLVRLEPRAATLDAALVRATDFLDKAWQPGTYRLLSYSLQQALLAAIRDGVTA